SKREASKLEAAQRLAQADAARAEEAEKRLRTEEELRRREVEGAQELARTEAKAARSLRRLTWILAAVAFLAVGGAIFGFWQRGEAERRKGQAEEYAKRVEIEKQNVADQLQRVEIQKKRGDAQLER